MYFFSNYETNQYETFSWNFKKFLQRLNYFRFFFLILLLDIYRLVSYEHMYISMYISMYGTSKQSNRMS